MKNLLALVFLLVVSSGVYAQDNNKRQMKHREKFSTTQRRSDSSASESISTIGEKPLVERLQLDSAAADAIRNRAQKHRSNFNQGTRRRSMTDEELREATANIGEKLSVEKHQVDSATAEALKKRAMKHRDNFNQPTQDRDKVEQPTAVRTLGKLTNAKGHMNASWGDEIFVKNKEIFNFDNFEKYEFETLTYPQGSCFALNKQYKTTKLTKMDLSKGSKTIVLNTLYVIDQKELAKKADLTKDEDLVLVDIILKRVIVEGDKYPSIYDLENIEKSQLAIKYKKNAGTKKAFFQIFVLEENGTLVSGQHNMTGNDIFLMPEDKLTADKFKRITTPRFYEDFYYETDYNAFTQFMQGGISGK